MTSYVRLAVVQWASSDGGSPMMATFSTPPGRGLLGVGRAAGGWRGRRRRRPRARRPPPRRPRRDGRDVARGWRIALPSVGGGLPRRQLLLENLAPAEHLLDAARRGSGPAARSAATSAWSSCSHACQTRWTAGVRPGRILHDLVPERLQSHHADRPSRSARAPR